MCFAKILMCGASAHERVKEVYTVLCYCVRWCIPNLDVVGIPQ